MRGQEDKYNQPIILSCPLADKSNLLALITFAATLTIDVETPYKYGMGAPLFILKLTKLLIVGLVLFVRD